MAIFNSYIGLPGDVYIVYTYIYMYIYTPLDMPSYVPSHYIPLVAGLLILYPMMSQKPAYILYIISYPVCVPL